MESREAAQLAGVHGTAWRQQGLGGGRNRCCSGTWAGPAPVLGSAGQCWAVRSPAGNFTQQVWSGACRVQSARPSAQIRGQVGLREGWGWEPPPEGVRT